MIESGAEGKRDRDRRFIRSDIAAIQRSDGTIDERKVDGWLGIAGDFKRDEELIGPEAAARYPKERWAYEGTRYETVRSILRATQPVTGQTFYDLGSGQGRVVLYGALASQAKFVGIELLQERIDACNKTKERLGIENAEFRVGNIVDCDFSDGDIFYLFNPFSPSTIKTVIGMLEKVAEKRKIQIVCTGVVQIHFSREPWLRLSHSVDIPEPIDIFESRGQIHI